MGIAEEALESTPPVDGQLNASHNSQPRSCDSRLAVDHCNIEYLRAFTNPSVEFRSNSSVARNCSVGLISSALSAAIAKCTMAFLIALASVGSTDVGSVLMMERGAKIGRAHV